MRKIFKDPNREQAFRVNGYCTLPNVLEDVDIQDFMGFYATIPAASNDTFYSSHWNDSPEYRRHVDNYLRPILFDKVKDIFEDYRPVYGYYLVKMPGDNGTVSIHQDWMLVDESKYVGITIWIPLVDTNLENGSFQVMENSHKFLSQIRGSNTHFPYRENLDAVHQKYLTNLNLKKGEAVIFDHRLAHASLPNYTNLARVAVGLVLLPTEASMIHHYFDPVAGEVSVYEVDDNFLIDFGLKDRPDRYSFIKKIKFTNPVLPIENLDIAYAIHQGI